MTVDDLKKEAEKAGYTVIKKPCYDCSCYSEYPNKCHQHKNGRWKCVDNYRPIEFKRNSNYSPITKCVKKDPV